VGLVGLRQGSRAAWGFWAWAWARAWFKLGGDLLIFEEMET
jgi:hypothetical protein